MKKILLLAASQLLLLLFVDNAYGGSRDGRTTTSDDDLCFHKGLLLYSLTDGVTSANYSTKPFFANFFCHHWICGEHDPEFLEYAVDKRWSVGMELSTDLLRLDPAKYYDNTTFGHDVDAQMWDLSLFASHHYLVSQSLDLSNFIGLGMSLMTINGKEGDAPYHYNADGAIVRVGTRATWYLRKGYGLVAILSAFANTNSCSTFNDNTFGKNYLTQVQGWSWEVGFTRRWGDFSR